MSKSIYKMEGLDSALFEQRGSQVELREQIAKKMALDYYDAIDDALATLCCCIAAGVPRAEAFVQVWDSAGINGYMPPFGLRESCQYKIDMNVVIGFSYPIGVGSRNSTIYRMVD